MYKRMILKGKIYCYRCGLIISKRGEGKGYGKGALCEACILDRHEERLKYYKQKRKECDKNGR
jgi:hypothetical protein